MRSWILPVGLALALPAGLGLLSVGCNGDDDGPVEQNCTDGVDDDNDGDVDCDDADCASLLACQGTDTDTDGDTGDTDDTGDTPTPELADVATATFYGDDDDQWVGFGIGGGTDVNGDGNPDLIVGAPKYDCEDNSGNNLANAGAAFVFFGPSSGSIDVSDADIVICGARPDAELGTAVGLSPDLTGDEANDIVVSAPRENAGRVFVFSGLAANAERYLADPGLEETPITVDIQGEGVEYHFGDTFALGPLGSERGGRVPSLVIGSDAWSDSGSTSGSNLGRTYVMQAPLDTEDRVRASRADTWFTGSAQGEDAGRSVTLADFNGDGDQDIAIGALGRSFDGATNGGAVYIKYGNFAGSRYVVDDADATLASRANEEGVGQVVANAGDYNDDGIADLLVGAHKASQERGATYVWFGSSTGWSDTDTSAVDVAYRGGSAFDRSGHGADGVGDITGDGVDDFAVGAFGFSDEQFSQRGAIYIVAGSDITGAVDIDRAAWATYIGSSSEEGAGHRIHAPGDVTGDGEPDLLIGAYRNDIGGDLSGAVYLLAGPIAQQGE